ncbi:MAG: sugar phosphate isomerase/epimerase [Acidimicrobiia bacterium]|nr:sugar phosphate isomerase/epimerase [Acidimicrobiia bacterium]
MFWAGRDPLDTVREQKSLGVRCGQLGVPGNVPMDLASAAQWRAALEAEQFTLLTVFAAYNGEDYADIPTVQRTVGWIPPATRAVRLQRTFQLSDFAKALGAPSIALHVGFVPEDSADPDFIAVREMTRLVCDYAAQNNQTFALETGQEPAHVLLDFFQQVGRDNLRINFDPANLILYGTGDPIEALGILGAHVVSVHAKDGDWPPKGVAGALGTEKPLGQGSVGMERFIAKLREVGYKGQLHIEREVPDHSQRLADIKMGVGLLGKLTQ